MDIFVVTCHKGWNRKNVLQLFLAETHAETIYTNLVLQGKEGGVMIVYHFADVTKILIAYIEGCANTPPYSLSKVRLLSSFDGIQTSSWSEKKR